MCLYLLIFLQAFSFLTKYKWNTIEIGLSKPSCKNMKKHAFEQLPPDRFDI